MNDEGQKMEPDSRCDNCEAAMDADDTVMHCGRTECPQVYCRHCVPVWCDGCGRLIGPDPAAATAPAPSSRVGVMEEMVERALKAAHPESHPTGIDEVDYAHRSAMRAALEAAGVGSVPADCDVRTILLEVYNTLDSDHEERYAKNVGDVQDEMLKMAEENDRVRGESNARAELLWQITRAMGLNLNADVTNNRHVVERAKFLSGQFTADRYTATEKAIAERDQLKERLAAMAKERDHWKANHDNQASIKRAVLDRPDLGDRAARVQELMAENARLSAQLAAGEWTQAVPTEQAWYWHWDGDEDSAPLLWCVLKSGTDGHCFTSANQHGVTHSISCEQWGGWWKREPGPKTPEVER